MVLIETVNRPTIAPEESRTEVGISASGVYFASLAGAAKPTARVTLLAVTNEGVILASGWFDEEGYGATLEDAAADYRSSLWDRYRSLGRRTRLSRRDRTILSRLRALFDPA